jgi:hypothetical protein
MGNASKYPTINVGDIESGNPKSGVLCFRKAAGERQWSDLDWSAWLGQ